MTIYNWEMLEICGTSWWLQNIQHEEKNILSGENYYMIANSIV